MSDQASAQVSQKLRYTQRLHTKTRQSADTLKVEQAIDVAWNPRADQTLKAQAFEFLSQLRSEPQGWQICLFLALRDSRPSEVVQHVSLDIVNDAVQRHQLNEGELSMVRENVMTYVRKTYGGGENNNNELDPLTIQNKIAQTLTYLFISMYGTSWTSFFHDILALTTSAGGSYHSNALGIRLYLRIVISIHDEIGDVLIPRSQDEQARDNELKDLVRERDVRLIASSWHEILSQWRSQDETVVDLCLAGLGRWVLWIDISLVVNDALLQLLFEHVNPVPPTDSQPKAQHRRRRAIETFVDLLSKKMAGNDKLELIRVLKVDQAVSLTVNSRSLTDLRSTSEYDTDFAEEVGRLVNNTVSDIVRVLEGALDKDTAMLQGTILLQTFLPFVIRFLSDEYDEICASVIPCLTDLLTLMRKKSKVSSTFSQENAPMLPLILDAVIAKLKYDETSHWGNDDAQTDEAEFQDLRRRLHVLQQAVAAVDEEVYISKIAGVVLTTFDNFRNQNGQMDWRDVDLALYEMFLFGELGLKNGGLYSKTKPASPASEHLINMMFKLIQSGIVSHPHDERMLTHIGVATFPHPAVQLQFMEVCVRYYMFFDANPEYITPVLEKFVQFVHHNHVKVKLRSWYLLQRLVKHVRNHIGDIAQTLIQSLGVLLPIKAELPEDGSENDDEEISSNDNGESPNAAFNSQLYLYEAVGCICSARALSLETQVVLLRSVINPLFADMQSSIAAAETGDKRASLQVHHLIMALGTLARGYSDWSPGSSSSSSPPPAPAVSDEFSQTAEAVLLALERLQSSFDVRESARFAFSRLVGVLGNRILPQLPRWIQGLLTRDSTKDEMALFMRLLDQVVFGFKTEIFSILNTLLTPFLQRVFTGLAEPASGTDDEIQLAELKREYLTFLLVVLNNNLEGVLVSDGRLSKVSRFRTF